MEANIHEEVSIIGQKLMFWADGEEDEEWTLGIVFSLGKASDMASLKQVCKGVKDQIM